jgi:NitT/TauT family transport system substrate-binding protein
MRVLSIVSGAVMVGLTFGATAAHSQDRVTLVLNWVTGGSHAPIFYAQKSGWFDEAGLDVNIEQGQGSSVAAQRVGAGSADIGIADLAASMVAKGAGANLVAVMNVKANSPYRMYWLKDSGIKTLEDFKGKKLGNPPGDAARAMWPAFARINGMDPDDVTWINIAATAKASALASRSIDGTTFFANFHHVMEGAFGDNLMWLSWPDAGLNPYGNSFVVNGDFLENNPEVVQRFVGVAQRAYRYCVDHGEECVSVLPEFASGLQVENELKNWMAVTDLMRDEVSTTIGLGYFDPERVAADYALVDANFELTEPFDPATVFTNEFIDHSIKMSAE